MLALLAVLSQAASARVSLQYRKPFALGPLAPSLARDKPGRIPSGTPAPHLRASLSTCSLSGGQTSGLAEEGIFFDITRGHPYQFGGRSSRSPQSLPYCPPPCQGTANIAGHPRVLVPRCLGGARFPAAHEVVQDHLQEPHHCSTTQTLCQVTSPAANFTPATPPRRHGCPAGATVSANCRGRCRVQGPVAAAPASARVAGSSAEKSLSASAPMVSNVRSGGQSGLPGSVRTCPAAPAPSLRAGRAPA